MPFETITPPHRLYRQVADQLRHLFDAGEFAVGDRLPPERELAERMGISRPTIREALIALEVEGRVRIKVGSGIYVAQPPRIPAAPATGEGPFARLERRARSLEREPAILSVSTFHVGSYIDVPEMGCSTLVITDGDRDLARTEAHALADTYWASRDEFLVERIPVAEAVRRGRSLEPGPILLLDTADTTGGGAAGDSIDVAMFYLSDRDTIGALLAAAKRGVTVRVILDPNKDAFGRTKNGIPNRSVSAHAAGHISGVRRGTRKGRRCSATQPVSEPGKG